MGNKVSLRFFRLCFWAAFIKELLLRPGEKFSIFCCVGGLRRGKKTMVYFIVGGF